MTTVLSPAPAEAPIPDFWGLGDEQLARSCVLVAQGCIPEADRLQKAEAMRLFLMWREAIHARTRSRAEVEERAGVLAALRKRTIQMLVAIYVACRPLIPER